MSQKALRHTSAALTLATLLALPATPAAAAARPARAEASFTAEAWRFLAGLFGRSPGAAVSGAGAHRGHGLTPIVGKLGGYLDPDGRTASLTTSTPTLVKP